VRFTLAVFAGSLVQIVPYVDPQRWTSGRAPFTAAYLLFAALGTGFFAGRRSAIAGALSIFIGVTLYGLLSFFSGQVGTTDAYTLAGYEFRLLFGVLPFAIGGAVTGAVGGWLRARVLSRAR
jgi:small-conductance mechanosensitive channel